MTTLAALVAPLNDIIREAGKAIMEVYEADAAIEVTNKEDDSPVTRADYAAHHVIVAGLQKLEQQYPILSEEGGLPDFATRSGWQRYWLVDPLDGTKEFINRNGEFTVNIALIDGHRPVLGLVYVPVKNILYIGVEGEGAWREQNGARTAIQAKPLVQGGALRVVGSRRHGAEALDTLLDRVSSQFSQVDLVSMGSSLKICALAEGTADWYPRLALTSEWDTAAAHAVLNAAGGILVDEGLEVLKYNAKEELLNPFFHAMGDPSFPWKTLIQQN
ncbi:MAG: 3'(2'),5'-bisphosphate nucleotidase CysQ [Oleiphilaceae bacterium]|nr:3'(2'),5'-bisphosphate nucleotidase CysQ [Oleiphilaceae bacterium]